MTVRVLPSWEWPTKLVGTELETVWPHLDAKTAYVIVVEDASDRVIGSWSLFPVYQVEGVSIDPTHQKRGAVAKLLLQQMQQLCQVLGVARVETGSLTPAVTTLIQKFQGREIPGARFVIETEKFACQQP